MAWLLTEQGLIPVEGTMFVVIGMDVIARTIADANNASMNVTLLRGASPNDCWQYIGRMATQLSGLKPNAIIVC